MGKTKKKNSSNTMAAEESKSKNIKGELDSLFKREKKSKVIKKPDDSKKEKTIDLVKDKVKDKKDKPKKSGNKYTKEGYKIYTAEELNIGMGGDTPDCPFDCNCCF